MLAEFLKEIANAQHVEFGKMVDILIPFAISKGKSSSCVVPHFYWLNNICVDEFTQLTALKWINEFILCGEEELLPYAADLVGAILPSISHQVQDIQQQASHANASLLRLINRYEWASF